MVIITQIKLKKFLKIGGLAGVPTAFIIIYYLVALNAITIISYSGDMSCAGTFEDPCKASITFKANQLVTVNPLNTTWLFNTDKKLKEIKVFWNGSEMNFSKTNKFYKNKNYTLEFYGYKNNPGETIKWSFGSIDPYWTPPASSNGINLTQTENLSFTGNQNITRTMYIYKYVNITQFSMNLSGFASSYYCYQESTNTTNQTGIDGNCELNYTGNYEPGTCVSSFGGVICTLNITYAKPANVTKNSLIQVRLGTNTVQNVSMPLECWNYDANYIKFIETSRSQGAASDLSCFTNTATTISLLSDTCSGGDQIADTPGDYFGAIDGDWNTGAKAKGTTLEWTNSVINNCQQTGILWEESMNWAFNIYLQNNTLSIGNSQIWNYSGFFNQSNNKTTDMSYVLNSALNNSNCNCIGCLLMGDYCNINFTFHSDNTGILNYLLNPLQYDLTDVIIRNTTAIVFYANTTAIDKIQPPGQTTTKGLFNVTNIAQLNRSISVRINETRNYIIMKINSVYNWTTSKILNTTDQKIINCMGANNSQNYLWMWADYTQNISNCYQSYPNVSNACGGLGTGSWSTNGNWSCQVDGGCTSFYPFNEIWDDYDSHVVYNPIQDAETSYDCFLEGNTWSPTNKNCSMAADQDWTTAASTFSSSGNYSVYENFTLAYDVPGASWKFKIGFTASWNVLPGEGCTEINYWNWTSNTWKIFGSSLYDSSPYGTQCYNLTNSNCISVYEAGVWNCTERLPNDAIDGNDIRIKTIVRQHTHARDYYEGELILDGRDAVIYYNYTAPSWAQGMTWEVSDIDGPPYNCISVNISLNSKCFAQGTKQLRVTSNFTDDHVYWECYNGTNWILQRTNTISADPEVCESAVIWERNKCFQTTATDATCGNQNMSHYPNGSYAYTKDWQNVSRIFDGNYYTGTHPNVSTNSSELYEKFQLPNYATSAQWMIHGDAALLNSRIEDIPASCFRNPIYTRIQEVNTSGQAWFGYFYCRNNTGWQYILSGILNKGINETAMIFNMSVRENTTFYPKVTITAGDC